MIWRKILNRLKNKNFSLVTYLVEIVLIILSVLIAIQADRYNQNRKNEAKLEGYLQAMHQDLLGEQERNRKNLYDCQKDLNGIQRCLQLARYNQDDSLDLALRHLGSVFTRGVFRTFPPTTFNIMLSTGDISLISDLEFRNRLAATFSFRDTYLKDDLQQFDAQVKELSASLGKYIDWACLATSERLHPCLIDRKGFVEDVHNDLFIFLRMTQLRAFHLEVAIQNFDGMIKEMNVYVPTEDSND
jgi:hypothetical protein